MSAIDYLMGLWLEFWRALRTAFYADAPEFAETRPAPAELQALRDEDDRA